MIAPAPDQSEHLFQQIHHLNWKGPQFRSRGEFSLNAMLVGQVHIVGINTQPCPHSHQLDQLDQLVHVFTHLVEIHSDSESTQALASAAP